jgi:chemotaxis regulatin CheY-phosphate phosphatase CheZ
VPSTTTQRTRLRRDTGTDSTSLPDAEIDDIYAEAEEQYTDAVVIDAYTRVIVFRQLLAQAAARTTYKQNQSQEELSDLFKHYQGMVKYWEDQLAEAVAAASVSGAARLGKTKRVPSRLKEYPDA